MDVVALIQSLGRTDVIDIGTAGDTEMLLPVSPVIVGALGAAALDSKIVR